jgi:hypothetical protein
VIQSSGVVYYSRCVHAVDHNLFTDGSNNEGKVLGRFAGAWSTKVTVGVKNGNHFEWRNRKMHLTVFAGAIVVFALNSSPGDCLWLRRREPNNANRTWRVLCAVLSILFERVPRQKIIIVFESGKPTGENMASCFRFHLSPLILNSPHAKKARKSFGGLFTLARGRSLSSSLQRGSH